MRAISSFKREAGISTFWCRAWSAFRTLVSISATGSVNLIVCFSLSHSFAPPIAENLQRLVPPNLLRAHFLKVVIQSGTFSVPRRITTLRSNLVIPRRFPVGMHTALPRRLRNPWNFPAKRQLPETQAANAELAQKSARTSAQLAAVVLARGKLGFSCVLNSFCCSRHFASSSYLLAVSSLLTALSSNILHSDFELPTSYALKGIPI